MHLSEEQEISICVFFLKAYMYFIISCAILFVLSKFVITISIVNGTSMSSTLEDGDVLIVNKIAYINKQIEPPDIVILKTKIGESKEETRIVKRVIAAERDALKIKDNKIYRNGKQLYENYMLANITLGEFNVKLKKDQLFVMGDNRLLSRDSRSESIGILNENKVIGKVIMRIYPFDTIRFFY